MVHHVVEFIGTHSHYNGRAREGKPSTQQGKGEHNGHGNDGGETALGKDNNAPPPGLLLRNCSWRWVLFGCLFHANVFSCLGGLVNTLCKFFFAACGSEQKRRKSMGTPHSPARGLRPPALPARNSHTGLVALLVL